MVFSCSMPPQSMPKFSEPLAPRFMHGIALVLYRRMKSFAFVGSRRCSITQVADCGNTRTIIQNMFVGVEKTPTPTLSALLRKWSVLLRADRVLTTDPRPLHDKTTPCQFSHKIVLRKAALGPCSERNRPLVKRVILIVKQ